LSNEPSIKTTGRSGGSVFTKAIVRNAISIFGARFINALSSLLIFLIVSHQLGKELFGIFALWNTIISSGIIIANFGTDILIIKMIKEDPAAANEILFSTIYLKIITSLLIVFLIAVGSTLYESDLWSGGILVFYSTTILINVISQSFWFYSDALNKMEYHGFLWAASNILKLFFIYIGFMLKKNLSTAIGAVILAEGLTLVLSYGMLKWKFQIRRTQAVLSRLAFIAGRAWPFAALLIVSVLYSRFDLFMVGFLCDARAVGEYAAASKFLEMISLLSGTLMIAVFPVLQSDYLKNDKAFRKQAKRMGLSLLAAGTITSLLVFYFSDILILRLYGSAFQDSVILLKILSMGIIFIFINNYMAYYHLVLNREKTVLYLVVGIAGFNVLLNFYGIGRYQHRGAAMARIVSEVILFMFYILLLCRDYQRGLNR